MQTSQVRAVAHAKKATPPQGWGCKNKFLGQISGFLPKEKTHAKVSACAKLQGLRRRRSPANVTRGVRLCRTPVEPRLFKTDSNRFCVFMYTDFIELPRKILQIFSVTRKIFWSFVPPTGGRQKESTTRLGGALFLVGANGLEPLTSCV